MVNRLRTGSLAGSAALVLVLAFSGAVLGAVAFVRHQRAIPGR